jgi:hypothetical protein
VSLGQDRDGLPVTVPIGPRNDRALAKVGAAFVAVIAIGLLGRLVPPPASRTGEAAVLPSVSPTAEVPVRLATPYSNVVFFRTTEIAVRGIVQPGNDALDVTVALDGRGLIGQATVEVEGGRFAGVVSIIPPAVRTAGTLEVRPVDGIGPALADVRFSVEAGGIVLPVQPSRLSATAGQPFLVDVLVYDDATEIRALLTNDGTLIAQASVPLRPRPTVGPAPRMIGLRLDVPEGRLPRSGRLHVIALDDRGREIEHIDATVLLTND